MFSHVMLGSNNIERAKLFYDAVLGVLGAGEGYHNAAPTGHKRLFYRHDGNSFGDHRLPIERLRLPKAHRG